MIVGWTGGIASGKTFCTDYLKNHYSINVIDADLVAREIVSPGSEALQAINAAFGPSVITSEGALNRGKMRELMLDDECVRRQLNAIIHPRVRAIMLSRLAQSRVENYRYLIMSVPLLLENGFNRYVSSIVVVDVSRATQISRLKRRDNANDRAIQQMLDVQMKRADRLIHANFIIDNDGSQQNTLNQLDHLHEQLCAISLASAMPEMR